MLRASSCLLKTVTRKGPRNAATEAYRDLHSRLLDERKEFDSALNDYSKGLQVAELDGGVLKLSNTHTVAAATLFNSARIARSSHTAREAFGTCVVGGSDAIRKIWHEYGMRPTCVFVPNDEDVPEWCYSESSPTLVVRADASRIKTDLLSSEFSDGYGAEFRLPPMPSLLDLVDPRREQQVDASSEASGVASTQAKLSTVLVLHQTRNPSNVGAMLRAAVDFGFDGVVMDRCADVFNEKVLRASEGAVFNPALRVFNLSERSTVNSTGVLQQAVMAHRLLPIFAVPDDNAEPVFSVAQKFHYVNRGKSDAERLGAMVVVGSEAQGLRELQEEWTLPAKVAGIKLDNSTVQSINVAFASSIMMHHFRPGAVKDFEAMFQRGLVPNEGYAEELLQLHSGGLAASSPSTAS